jgi:hypothetical protein
MLRVLGFKAVSKSMTLWKEYLWHSRSIETTRGLEICHATEVKSLHSNIEKMSISIRKSVKRFRHRAFTIMIARAAERGRQLQLRRAFHDWNVRAISQKHEEYVLASKFQVDQATAQALKNEQMTHWAINVARVEAERSRSKLLQKASFHQLQVKVAQKQRDQMKLNYRMYRARILYYMSRALSNALIRHEKGKLARGFYHWKLLSHVEKAQILERKTEDLHNRLVHAKVGAENAIVEIVRERLRGGPSSSFGRH